jgi:hypothetical protein
MSVHTIIVLLVLYCAVRALLRKKPTDPMAGRLVPRTGTVDVSWHKEQHDTFDARHTVDFSPPKPAAPVKPGHYLKAYWPKGEPLPEGWGARF